MEENLYVYSIKLDNLNFQNQSKQPSNPKLYHKDGHYKYYHTTNKYELPYFSDNPIDALRVNSHNRELPFYAYTIPVVTFYKVYKEFICSRMNHVYYRKGIFDA